MQMTLSGTVQAPLYKGYANGTELLSFLLSP